MWSASSTQIEVRNTQFLDSPPAPSPSSSSSCWTLKTEAMSAAQRAALESVVLVPLNPICTADGYQYDELTVIGPDGTRTAYRDTGCNFLAVPGARAMLPSDWQAGLVSDGSTECAKPTENE